MFSIISLVVGIALALALAGVGIYYGGHVFDESAAMAEVAKYRNEAQQISGAMTLYAQGNQGISEDFSLTDLAPKYLKAIPGADESSPAGAGWKVTSEKVVKTNIAPKVCYIANRESGFTFQDGVHGFSAADGQPVEGVSGQYVPNCSWSGLDSDTPCCYTDG